MPQEKVLLGVARGRRGRRARARRGVVGLDGRRRCAEQRLALRTHALFFVLRRPTILDASSVVGHHFCGTGLEGRALSPASFGFGGGATFVGTLPCGAYPPCTSRGGAFGSSGMPTILRSGLGFGT